MHNIREKTISLGPNQHFTTHDKNFLFVKGEKKKKHCVILTDFIVANKHIKVQVLEQENRLWLLTWRYLHGIQFFNI